MIKNLDDTQFEAYGQFYTADFKDVCSLNKLDSSCVVQLNITLKSIKFMVCTEDYPSILGLIEGLALLCLLEESSLGKVMVFLLDKPVLLKPGVFYSIVPLYGVCSVLLAKRKGAKISEISLSQEFTPLGINPMVNINKAYTLFYQEKGGDFIFKGEKHNFWELTYIDKGVLVSIVDGVEFVTGSGELIFYSENQHHIQHAGENMPVSFITITFDMDFNEGSFLTNRIFELDQDMKDIINKIIFEKEGSYYSDDLIICYLKILIINLVRNGRLENAIQSLEGTVKHKIENSIVNDALAYIHSSINKKLSLSEIASYVHISQSYLSYIFKRNMDMTVVDYISNYRLDKSTELIKSSSLNFTEIAEMLGYGSIHYFSRQFKTHFGISPTDYRKKQKIK